MSLSDSKNNVEQEIVSDYPSNQNSDVINEIQIPVEPAEEKGSQIENPQNFGIADNESDIPEESPSLESLTKTEVKEEGVIGNTGVPIDILQDEDQPIKEGDIIEDPSEDPEDFWGIGKEPTVPKATLTEEVKNQGNTLSIDTKKDSQEKFQDLKEKVFSKIRRIKEDSVTEIKMTLFGGKAIIKRGGVNSFCYSPESWGFKELDSSVARYFIRNGNAQDVVDNISQFGILDKELIYKILEKAEPHWWFFNDLRQNYKQLDFDDIGSYLLQRGNFKALAENIDYFPLINNQNIAIGLLNSGQFRVLAENIDRFSDLNNEEYVEKFFEAGQFESLALNMYRFHGVDHKNIANRFLKVGQIETLADNLNSFYGLDLSIADTLMRSGFKLEVAENLISFRGVNYSELASQLLDENESGVLAECLSNFFGLDNNIALSLIKRGYGKAVIQSASTFPRLDHEIIKEAIISNPDSSFGSPIPFINKLSDFGFSDDEEREIYRSFWIRRAESPVGITYPDAEDALDLASCMREKNLPADIKLSIDIFGDSLSPESFLCVRTLLNNEPPNEDLRSLGINETGNLGLIKLKKIYSELLKSFNTCNIGEKELTLLEKSEIAREIFSEISGFNESNWGGHDENDLIEKIQLMRKLNSDGLHPDVQLGLEPSEVYEIKKLNSKEFKEGFSEDVLMRYSTLRNDLFGAIDAVNRKEGMGALVWRIRFGIEQIFNATNYQIKAIDPFEEKAEKKRENLEKKRAQLEQYLEETDISSRRNPNIPLDTQARFVIQSPKTFVRGLSVLSRYEELYSPIRQLVFAGALRKFPGQITALSELNETPEIEDLSRLKEFIDHTVSEEMYGEYFSGDRRLAKTFNKISNTDAFEKGIEYYMKIAPRVGKNRIQFIPTKGLMLEISGQIANACWADKYESVSEQMPNMSAIIMRARPEEKTERIVGAALLIDTFSPVTKEKVLLLRGVNPTENFIHTVDANEFFRAIIDYLRKTALKRGMVPAVVIDDHSGGAGTNRPALFYVISEKKNNLVKIRVDKKTTFFNGYDVTDDSYRLD